MASPEKTAGQSPQINPNLLQKIKRLGARFGTAEVVSWIEGTAVAISFFELARWGLLPPELAGIVLFTGDSFAFMATNYLMKLQENKMDKSSNVNHYLLLNPRHYINALLHPELKVNVSWSDRLHAVKDVFFEFGVQDVYDVPVRTTIYHGLSKDFHTWDPTSSWLFLTTLGAYLSKRGGIEVIYYTWPTFYNLVAKPLISNYAKKNKA